MTDQRRWIGDPDDDFRRSLLAEQTAENALNAMKGREHHYGIKHQIREVIRVEHNSTVDKQHVDIIAVVEGGLEVPFQVKQTVRAANRFNRKYRRYGYGIIQTIVVQIGDDITAVIDAVAEKLRLAIAQLLRIKNSRIWKYRRQMWKVAGRPPLTNGWRTRHKPDFVRVESMQMSVA